LVARVFFQDADEVGVVDNHEREFERYGHRPARIRVSTYEPHPLTTGGGCWRFVASRRMLGRP
jgi:hypothetical protein